MAIGPDAIAMELRTTSDGRTIVRMPVVSAVGPMLADAPIGYGDGVAASSCVCGGAHSAGCDCAFDSGCVGAPSAFAPCSRENLWVDLDFLLWWRDQRRFPALVTQGDPGTLPSATVLFGGSVDETAQPGGRLEVGLWLDDRRWYGLGGHFVAVSDARVRLAADSANLGFLARPFLNVAVSPPVQDALVVGNTETTAGQLDLTTGSKMLASDFFVRWLLRRTARSRVDWLFGYQFARIDEDLEVSSATQTVPDALSSIAVSDVFRTTNQYHAGHIGLKGEYRFGYWGLELLARFGFGNMRQQVVISGSTTARDDTGTSTRASGLLAQGTNSGTYVQNEFAFMEDVGVKLVYYPFDRLKLSVGYSLMYWTSVLRPGNTIDFGVDSRLLDNDPTNDSLATRPAFVFNPEDFYVHGLTLGLECRF